MNLIKTENGTEFKNNHNHSLLPTCHGYPMEQHAYTNNYLNTNFYSYLETFGGQCSNLYLNVDHFFNTSVN